MNLVNDPKHNPSFNQQTMYIHNAKKIFRLHNSRDANKIISITIRFAFSCNVTFQKIVLYRYLCRNKIHNVMSNKIAPYL